MHATTDKLNRPGPGHRSPGHRDGDRAYTRRKARRGRPHGSTEIGSRERGAAPAASNSNCENLSIGLNKLSQVKSSAAASQNGQVNGNLAGSTLQPRRARVTRPDARSKREVTCRLTIYSLTFTALDSEWSLALPSRRLLRPENVVVRDLEKLLEFGHLLLVRSWPLKLQDDVLSAPPRFVAADGPHDLVEFHELCW